MELLSKYNLNNNLLYKIEDIPNYKEIFCNEDIILIFKKNIINDELAESNQYYSLFLGLYYNFQIIDPDLMIKYYLLSVNLENHYAMVLLGNCYYNINNHKLANKYYLMATNYGNGSAMSYLGLYYKNIEKNYDLMKKYYQMSIAAKYDIALYLLGEYYATDEKNYNLMKQYFLMYYNKNKKNIFILKDINIIYIKYNYSYL